MERLADVRWAASLVAGVLALAGCGGGSKTPAQPSSPSTTRSTNVKTITVKEWEYRVQPSVSRVKLGTYIFKGVNTGTIPHVLELEGPGLENETGTIAPGKSQSVQLILRNPGKYELYCPLDAHKKKGMKAVFIVEK